MASFSNVSFRIIASILIVSIIVLFSTWKKTNVSISDVKLMIYDFVTKNKSDKATNATNAVEILAATIQSEENQSLSKLKQKSMRIISPQLSPNYLLWSHKPVDAYNWSDVAQQMCHQILWPSTATESDKKYQKALSTARNWVVPSAHTDESVLSLLSNCTEFRRLIQFPTKPASNAEAQFPLAYVVVGARNAAQTVRFFRSIYQPQNAYCLTYDNKSAEVYKKVIKQLSTCFELDENVFLTPAPENIYYGMYSILHSVMVCMKVLLDAKKKIPWRYVQIVSWNDFPLRTNAEMVKIFRILNGSQDCALDPLIPAFYIPNWYDDGKMRPDPRTVPPDGLTMYKGSYATSMTSEFVEFLFTDPTSVKFYQWLNGSKVCEEYYWTTIIHNLQLNAPGSFPGQCLHFYVYKNIWKPFVSRYQVWIWPDRHAPICKGKITSASCVYGVGDLAVMIGKPELMAHKFYDEFEPATTFCLEYWYWNKLRNSTNKLNESYYENLPSVRYQKLDNKNNFYC